MNNSDRLKKIAELYQNDYNYNYPQPIEAIAVCGGKICQYLLFWADIDRRALIDATTGCIVTYCRPNEEGGWEEYNGNDLYQFNDEIDARLEVLEKAEPLQGRR